MKEKTKSNLIIEIENKIEQTININNFKIVDIDITGGKNKQISIIIYNNENSGIDELAKISRIIKPLLESMPALKDDFTLEVSSPGIYRNIKYLKEFDIFKERKIKIITTDGAVFDGTSHGIEKNYLIFTDDKNETKNIILDDIVRANLDG